MMTREEKNKDIVNEIKREEAIKISKRLLKYLAIVIFIFGTIFLYMYFIGTKGLKTKEYIIKNSNIPSSFHGVKILHFSDLLYGKTITNGELTKIQDEIKLINPNIVVFTGNIIDKEYQVDENEIKSINTFFKEIPYTIGKYAVKGDQDNSSFDLIMEDTDFTILNNELLEIYNKKNESINIIGININEDKSINNTSDKYTISIIHDFDQYQKYQVKSNLVLAGHNLGGEIRIFGIPFLGNSKYNDSYYEENNSIIYISSGLGSINHVRLFNKPSINVYRLYQK